MRASKEPLNTAKRTRSSWRGYTPIVAQTAFPSSEFYRLIFLVALDFVDVIEARLKYRGGLAVIDEQKRVRFRRRIPIDGYEGIP